MIYRCLFAPRSRSRRHRETARAIVSNARRSKERRRCPTVALVSSQLHYSAFVVAMRFLQHRARLAWFPCAKLFGARRDQSGGAKKNLTWRTILAIGATHHQPEK